MLNDRKNPLPFIIWGLVLGLIFPFLGTVQGLVISGKATSIENILSIHRGEQFLWIIDTAPIIFVFFAFLLWKQTTRVQESSLQLRDHITKQEELTKTSAYFFQALVRNSPLAVVQLDNDRKIIALNPTFEKLFGYAENEVLGEYIDPLVASRDHYAEASELSDQVTSGQLIRKTSRRMNRTGELIDVEIFGVPVMVGGEKVGALAMYNDIREAKQRELALRESESRFRGLFDNSPISLWEEDFSGIKKLFDKIRVEEDLVERLQTDNELVQKCIHLVKILDVNQATVDLYKAKTKEDLLLGLDRVLTDQSFEAFKGELIALANNVTTYRCEIAQKRLDGKDIYGLLSYSIVPGYEDSWGNVILSFVDITDKKLIEEQLRFISFHDALTGLYNRAYFEEEMSRIESSRLFPVTIIMCDLDNLKRINDTLGHNVGDKAIKSAAKVLINVFRKEDLVARIGGDEFVVLLQKADPQENPSILARLYTSVSVFNATEAENSIYHPISLSFGVACIKEGESLWDGIKIADQAMYADKISKCGKKQEDGEI